MYPLEIQKKLILILYNACKPQGFLFSLNSIKPISFSVTKKESLVEALRVYLIAQVYCGFLEIYNGFWEMWMKYKNNCKEIVLECGFPKELPYNIKMTCSCVIGKGKTH